MRIAVYGKGGIGKSTVTSNLSYCLSKKGHRVMQIGCDPKCDSTRPLLKGRFQTTVTRYIRDTPPSKRRLEDIVAEGTDGILCVEAGGPRPGTGCAGKGIISMFSTLERMGVDSLGTDFTLYDVLGDVVCGGFSIPMRPEHSDIVLIVTSGEYMSLFATNNIMKGSLQFEKDGGRVAGLILNRRGLDNEDGLVEEFSKATGVPILGKLERSELFRTSEATGRTLSESYPDSSEARTFMGLADTLCGLSASGIGSPTPLTDIELDSLYSQGRFEGRGTFVEETVERSYSDPLPVMGAPRRIGKGPVAAVLEAGKVTDIPVVIHGTRSCGFTMLNEVSEQRIAHILSDSGAFVAPGDNIVSTDMSAESSVFGGNDRLRETLEGLLEDNDVIIVIATCLPGMIGDDCSKVISDLESKNPGHRILYVDANRVDSGFDAHMEVIRAFSELIDPGVEPEDAYLNVVDDNFISFNKGDNRKHLSSLLSEIGMVLGPGFLNDCSVDDIRNLRRYGMSVLCENSRDNLATRGILKSKGIEFMGNSLPKGYSETLEWMRELMFLKGKGGNILERISEEYDGCVSRYSKDLSGRRIGILSWDPRQDAWIADALSDCGCDVTIHTLGASDSRDRRITVHESMQDLTNSIGQSDAVIDCMSTDIPGTMEKPDTWLSHRASMELIRRVWGFVMSKGEGSWAAWGD